VEALLKDIAAEHGPIARVYNAAAIQPTSLLLEQDVAEIHRVMQINYGGLVNVSLAALRVLLAQGSGSLINFCSIAGWVPNLHFGAYSASKFAAVAFTEVLHHENRGRGVHIACVCPAQVDTPLRAQARSKPKIMETGPRPMQPGVVLDAIDRAIARQRFWVYPGLHTAIGVRIRRFLPALLWRIGHRAEGF
jgi:short-subunit dehydrogenase